MKTLVAGVGNLFFGDDAFGSVVAQAFPPACLPADARVEDFGIRGLHLAYEMLEGYEHVVLIDTVSRGEAPGTLYLIEPSDIVASAPDAHAMQLHDVLGLFERLADEMQPTRRPTIAIVGCEPASMDEGIGLSEPVSAAVAKAITLTCSVVEAYGAGVAS